MREIGQYYLVINLDRKEYLYPHKFNDGLKLLEFGCSQNGTMTGLAILLASGNGRGGGDLQITSGGMYKNKSEIKSHQRIENAFEVGEKQYAIIVPTIVGSWAGDRIVIAGDYDDPDKFAREIGVESFGTEIYDGKEHEINLYQWIKDHGEDISEKVLKAMCDDEYIKESILKQDYKSDPHREAMKKIGVLK